VQLQAETNPALNTVTAYSDDDIQINQVSYSHAVYFAPEGEIHALAAKSVGDITPGLLREVAGLDDVAIDPMAFLDGSIPEKPQDAPEVIVIGTGQKQQFLPAPVLAPLLRLGIGVETMTTQAAARTYNILMAEGRRVVAALLPQKEA
jgi:uncharacterized protein